MSLVTTFEATYFSPCLQCSSWGYEQSLLIITSELRCTSLNLWYSTSYGSYFHFSLCHHLLSHFYGIWMTAVCVSAYILHTVFSSVNSLYSDFNISHLAGNVSRSFISKTTSCCRVFSLVHVSIFHDLSKLRWIYVRSALEFQETISCRHSAYLIHAITKFLQLGILSQNIGVRLLLSSSYNMRGFRS